MLCKYNLKSLADEYDIPLGLFLLCGPKPLMLEQRGSHMPYDEAKNLQPEEKDELIKIFPPGSTEPRSIVDVDESFLKICSNFSFELHRLYLVCPDTKTESKLSEIKRKVASWK
jgi:hypothetical protein